MKNCEWVLFISSFIFYLFPLHGQESMEQGLYAPNEGLFTKESGGPTESPNKELPYPPDLDSFFDKVVDYSKFVGRVSDRDGNAQVLKIKTETANVRFLRVGDKVSFTVNQHEDRTPCDGFVRGYEKSYLVVYVKNLGECWRHEAPFRRGTQLNLSSQILYQRVIAAAQYRKVLIKSRKDFLKQLNTINHFLWAFDQEKIKAAAEYDRRILEIQNDKQKIMDDLLGKKEEKLVLQKELITKLDIIDESLSFYLVDKQEYFLDRWHLDHEMGLPTGKRPQDIIRADSGELDMINTIAK